MGVESELHISPYDAVQDYLKASGPPPEGGFLLPQLLTKASCSEAERQQLLGELRLVFTRVDFWKELSADLQASTDPSISVERFLSSLDTKSVPGHRGVIGKYHPYYRALSLIQQDLPEKERKKFGEYTAFYFTPDTDSVELRDIILQTRVMMRDSFALPNRWIPLWRQFNAANPSTAVPHTLTPYKAKRGSDLDDSGKAVRDAYPNPADVSDQEAEASLPVPTNESFEKVIAHAVLSGSSLSIGERSIPLTDDQRAILLALASHAGVSTRHSTIASKVYEGKGFSRLGKVMEELQVLRSIILTYLGKDIIQIGKSDGFKTASQLINCTVEVVVQEEKDQE